MPSGNDHGEPKTTHHRRGTQAIANESWPLRDKDGGHARGIEDQLDTYGHLWPDSDDSTRVAIEGVIATKVQRVAD